MIRDHEKGFCEETTSEHSIAARATRDSLTYKNWDDVVLVVSCSKGEEEFPNDRHLLEESLSNVEPAAEKRRRAISGL